GGGRGSEPGRRRARPRRAGGPHAGTVAGDRAPRQGLRRPEPPAPGALQARPGVGPRAHPRSRAAAVARAMVEQETLRRLFLESVAARGHALEDVASFVDGRWQAREVAGAASALAILRRFDLEEFLQGATGFVARLAVGARDDWYRGFTRTSFLV